MRQAIRQILFGEPRFTPSALYRAGQVGAVYDPAQWATTMFQDSAGTTSVTALEQPVGKILDVSGQGNHALMATAPNRPILKQDASGRYFLRFDNTDYLTAAFSPTAGSAATVLFETPAGLATLPAQNVGTSYGLPMRSVDVYGIQIVDTAPTPKQQAQLERYWQAGTVPSYVYEVISGTNETLTADDGSTLILTE